MVPHQRASFQQARNRNHELTRKTVHKNQQFPGRTLRSISKEKRCFRPSFQRRPNYVVFDALKPNSVAESVRRRPYFRHFCLLRRAALRTNLRQNKALRRTHGLGPNQKCPRNNIKKSSKTRVGLSKPRKRVIVFCSPFSFQH